MSTASAASSSRVSHSSTISLKMPQKLPKQECSWHSRIIRKLDRCETKLDKLMPNSGCQRDYDDFLAALMPQAEHSLFDQWLYDNGQGKWYEQMAIFLAKLPVKAANNILNTLLNLIKIAIAVPTHIIMHPLKSCLKLVKLLVSLIHSLTQPETWTKLGISILGSTLGHATVTSNPIGLFAIAIGGALAVAGISLGTLKTAILAQKGKRISAVGDYLGDQVKKLPEDFLTGYCTVLLLEGVQQVLRGCQKFGRWIKHKRNISSGKDTLSRNQTNDFLNKYHYPSSDQYWRSGDTSHVYWHVERSYGNNNFIMNDLPEGKFLYTDIHTRTEYITSHVWVPGYYDSAGNYVYGHMNTVITPVPVYEKFFGYQLPLRGWVEPPMPALPPPIRLNESVVPYLGAGSTISDFVEKQDR